MKKVLFTVTGALLAAAALNIFLLPSGFAPGGVSGIALIINILTKGLIPVGASTFVLNIPLFILGYRVLGRRFAVNSLLGTLLFSIAADALGVLTELCYPFVGNDNLLNAIYGGLFFGLGLGLIFRGGATTGGTDIAARVLQLKFSWLTLGQIVLAFDIALLGVVAVSYRSVSSALYSGVVVFLSSKVIDVAEGGVNYAKQVYIILPGEDVSLALSREIMEKIHRGVTKLSGWGMHSGKMLPVLLCVVGNRQLSGLRSLVKQYDEQAFIIVSDVREIQGSWRK